MINYMPIPRKFEELSHDQLMHFAKIGFETYWNVVDSASSNEYFNQKKQEAGKEVTRIQELINKQNQEMSKPPRNLTSY